MKQRKKQAKEKGEAMKCKHRKSWLMCGAYSEWCYQCGAVRMLSHGEGNSCYPTSTWQCPVGSGQNPYEEWGKRNLSYLKRRITKKQKPK